MRFEDDPFNRFDSATLTLKAAIRGLPIDRKTRRLINGDVMLWHREEVQQCEVHFIGQNQKKILKELDEIKALLKNQASPPPENHS